MENKVIKLLNPYLYRDILTVAQGDVDLAPLKNSTVIVTGAGQSAGYYIACALLVFNDISEANIRVIAVDRDNNLMEKYSRLALRNDIDFTVSETLGNLPDGADYIIHNEYGGKILNETVINLLKYIRENKVTGTVINTGIEVYGTVYNGKTQIFEDDPGYVDLANPEMSYIQSLRMAECAAVNFAKEENQNIKIARSGTVYGLPMEKSHPYYSFFGNKEDAPSAVFAGAPAAVSGYCYVTDCARGVLTVLLKGESGVIYNVSSDNSVASGNDLSEIIAKNTDNSGAIKTEKAFSSALAPTPNVLNTDRLKALGFTPGVDLETGYKRIAAIIRSYSKAGDNNADERNA